VQERFTREDFGVEKFFEEMNSQGTTICHI
jgi:hypothetical protein